MHSILANIAGLINVDFVWLGVSFAIGVLAFNLAWRLLLLPYYWLVAWARTKEAEEKETAAQNMAWQWEQLGNQIQDLTRELARHRRWTEGPPEYMPEL